MSGPHRTLYRAGHPTGHQARHWVLRLAVAAIACSLVVGCNGATSPTDPDPRSDPGVGADQKDQKDQNDKGAAGGPLERRGNDEKEAPGSPIDIPNITIAQGSPLEDVKKQIEKDVRDQCGGQLCLRLRIEYTHPNFEICEFVTTRPEPKTRVKRWSRVVLVAGNQPCQSPGTTPTPGPPEPSPQEPSPQEPSPAPAASTGIDQ